MSEGSTGGLRSDASPVRARDRWLRSLLHLFTWSFERVPIDRAVALGGFLGRAWAAVGGPRTARVRDQLAFAMPEVDASRRDAWAREVFEHLGRSLAESIVLLGRRRAELLERVRVDGLEHLEAAARASRTSGTLVVTAHFGNWELACAKVASLGIPLSVVVRGLDDTVLDAALDALRRGDGPGSDDGGPIVDPIVMGTTAGLRLVRALRDGRTVLVLLDQDARPGEGVFVNFFGHLASTRHGPFVLEALRDVSVLTAFIRRDPDARGHRLVIHPALQLEPGASDDEEALRRNVQRLTSVIESEIRASPGQWIWTHRRWRTQPEPIDRSPPAD